MNIIDFSSTIPEYLNSIVLFYTHLIYETINMPHFGRPLSMRSSGFIDEAENELMHSSPNRIIGSSYLNSDLSSNSFVVICIQHFHGTFYTTESKGICILNDIKCDQHLF